MFVVHNSCHHQFPIVMFKNCDQLLFYRCWSCYRWLWTIDYLFLLDNSWWSSMVVLITHSYLWMVVIITYSLIIYNNDWSLIVEIIHGCNYYLILLEQELRKWSRTDHQNNLPLPMMKELLIPALLNIMNMFYWWSKILGVKTKRTYGVPQELTSGDGGHRLANHQQSHQKKSNNNGHQPSICINMQTTTAITYLPTTHKTCSRSPVHLSTVAWAPRFTVSL